MGWKLGRYLNLSFSGGCVGEVRLRLHPSLSFSLLTLNKVEDDSQHTTPDF
jgi:hypothetical protein